MKMGYQRRKLSFFNIILLTFLIEVTFEEHISRMEQSTFDFTLLKHRRKRDINDVLCNDKEAIFQSKIKNSNFTHSTQIESDSKNSLALAWGGENDGKILMVTTHEVLSIFASPSTVYQSKDDGKTFVKINERVDDAVIRGSNGLQKHPFYPKRLYLVAYNEDGGGSDIYVTENGGDTFAKYHLEFTLDSDIKFHPNKAHADYLMTVESRTRVLWVSKDNGRNWESKLNNVHNLKWSDMPGDDAGSIYATVSKSPLSYSSFFISESKFNLSKSKNLGDSWTVLLKNVYNFGSHGKFLYASVASDEDEDKRLIKISTDGGSRWNDVQLPTITSDRFFSVMDMSEGMIFMHVDEPENNGYGTLYTSDTSGIVFSESLKFHLYPNFADFNDFYKVLSMRGVYITSVIAKNQDIQTKISFDRGGEWVNIERPAGVDCLDEAKECFLQIHHMYSLSKKIKARPPLSVENAPGLILVHAHVADSLHTSDPDVFVSSDGGYSWSKALDGPHEYQIADHGGLIVAISLETAFPDTIKFSTDEGQCWHSYKFTEEKIKYTGLLTEPGKRAMSVAVWGFAEDHEWKSIVIDFTKVIDRACDSNTDYEIFTPHYKNEKEGCLLGVKEFLWKLKKDSWCSNGFSHEVTKKNETCECTKADYECAYGYYRKENSEICILQSDYHIKDIEICLQSKIDKVMTKGYRKIPGDQCQGGFIPAGEKFIVTKEGCSNAEHSIQYLEFLDPTTKPKSKFKSGNFLVIGSLLIFSSVLILLALYIKKVRKRHHRIKYSMLQADDAEDTETLISGTSMLYDDEDQGILSPKSDNYSSLQPSSPAKLPVSSDDFLDSALTNIPYKSYHDDSDVDLIE